MAEITQRVSGCLINEHYYIAVTMRAFKDYVGDWIGNVNNCYTLHSRYLDQSLTPFSSTVPLEIVHNSDEKLFYATGCC